MNLTANAHMVMLCVLLLASTVTASLHAARPHMSSLHTTATHSTRQRLHSSMKAADDDTLSTIDREMLDIAGPALVGLAIDPLAGLVDTAMIGRMCTPPDLAGVGVAIGAYNVVVRTFNFVSSATTSQVASLAPTDAEPGTFDLAMSRGAAAALAVALTIGSALLLLLCGGSAMTLRALGVSACSQVHGPARRYLAIRALAAPASLSLMALQGSFRGSRDTRTPLGAALLATTLNIVLDPLLIRIWGVAGAALATVLSQYAAVGLLWYRLVSACGEACATPHDRFLGLPRPSLADCVRIGRAGSWLTLRTLATSVALSYSSFAAATLSATRGAAHQICFQVWLAASLLADAVAMAAQALIAQAIALVDGLRVRTIVRRTLALGLASGFANAIVLATLSRPLVAVFSADTAVLSAAAQVWPFVVLSQPLNTLAFVADGLLFGASDFRWCALMSVVAAVPALAAMRFAASTQGGLPCIWSGLAVFMGLRSLLGFARVWSKRGPWKKVAR